MDIYEVALKKHEEWNGKLDTTAKAKTKLEVGDKIRFLYNGYVKSGSKAGAKKEEGK